MLPIEVILAFLVFIVLPAILLGVTVFEREKEDGDLMQTMHRSGDAFSADLGAVS